MLGKWLYDLGKRHAYDQLKSELYLYIGREPIRYQDLERGISESEIAYKKRIDAWFAARELLDRFFDTDPNKDTNWL